MASHTSKTMIAPLQVSLDGFIEGPRGKGLSRFVGQRTSSSAARTTYTWCRSRLRPPVCAGGYGEVSP